MDIGDAERFQIIEPVGDVFQVAGEAVDVEHVAGHVGALEPVGLEVALEVEPFQSSGRAAQVGQQLGQRRAEALVVRPLAIEALQHAEQVGAAALHAQVEDAVVERVPAHCLVHGLWHLHEDRIMHQRPGSAVGGVPVGPPTR